MRMKKLKLFFCYLLMVFTASNLWAVSSNEVATIDLSMAFSLHPKMSLFDFNRIGFYKVDFGLTYEEFVRRTEELRFSAPDRSQELKNIEQELEELYKKRSGFSQYYVNATKEKMTELERVRKESQEKEAELNNKILDIHHQRENFDITSPEETIKIAAEIEKEIFEAINEVAKEKKYAVVLNTTVPSPYNYKKNYIQGEIYGQGIPGINFMLFYSFLAKNNLDNPTDKTPPSRDLINWLELTRYPGAINILPMRPYPLVLSGGNSILSEVVQKLYNKYKVDSAVYDVVDSVITKIEQLQQGKPLEKRQTRF